MSVAICTYTAYQDKQPEYILYTDALKKMYCDKFGFKYYKEFEKNYQMSFHPFWMKSPTVQKLLKEGYDWVIWMDADAAPMNFILNIQDYLSQEHKGVIIQEDINGINAGVFAVPNCEKAFEFLKDWFSLRQEPKYQIGYVDQDAMVDLFRGKYNDFFVYPPSQLGWNNYDYNVYKVRKNIFLPNDWCIHFPGISNEMRNELFKQIFKNSNFTL